MYVMKGWELDERRNDGKWYAVSRNFEIGAKIYYERWLNFQPLATAQRFHLREVADTDPLLSASPVPDPQPEDAMTTTERKNDANKEGQVTATTLVMLFGKPNPDSKAVFSLGRRFARFAGYDDADEVFSYLEGFVQGFQEASSSVQAQISPQNPLNPENPAWKS